MAARAHLAGAGRERHGEDRDVHRRGLGRVAVLREALELERARAGLEPALLAEFACGSFPDGLAQLHLAAEAIELPLAESALLEAEKNARTIPYLWSISTAGAEALRRHPPPKSERTKETNIACFDNV